VAAGRGGLRSQARRGRDIEPQYGRPPAGAAIRGINFPHSDVAIRGRQVAVSGRAYIHDRTPGAAYCWLLRVSDQAKPPKLLKEHHYVDHARFLPEGQETMTMDFADTIELEPGKYLLELTIYGQWAGRPLEWEWGADVKHLAMGALTHPQRITVGE
jgi:hypothetical protein